MALVHFDLSPEQQELRTLARGFLAATSPESRVREVMATADGVDLPLWRRLATEPGLVGLGVPEEYGGAGQGLVEVGVVAEELGRGLTCVPFLSTQAAATALLQADDEPARRRYLPDLVAGRLVATLAVTEPGGRWDRDAVATRAEADGAGAGWRLTGTKAFVLDGHVADLLLVAAGTADGIGLFGVAADAGGLRREPLDTLDPTRRQATVHLDRAPATRLAVAGDAWPVVARALDEAAAVLAAEQVGIAQQALDLSVAYAKVREQFGRPIGSFQAVKHQLADVLLEVESARAAAWYALLAAAGDPGFAATASLAKAFCSDACLLATQRMIQVHGGIGFTWEHPAHLYLKRARSSAQLFGDPAHHRERLLREVGV